MSWWQFAAASEGYRKAHSTGGPEAPSEKEFDDMLERHEAALAARKAAA